MLPLAAPLPRNGGNSGGGGGSAQRADMRPNSASNRTLESQQRVMAAIQKQSAQRRSSAGAMGSVAAKLVNRAQSARQRVVRNYNDLRPPPAPAPVASSSATAAGGDNGGESGVGVGGEQDDNTTGEILGGLAARETF